MHVFHIRGFSSILVLILGILAILGIAVALPATFFMVLWNALVFEGIKTGPEINFYEGCLLWSFVMVLIKLVFNPQIQFQIQSVRKDGKPAPLATHQAQENSLDQSNDAQTPEKPTVSSLERDGNG